MPVIHPVSEADFASDAHAAKYRAEFERHPTAMRRVLAILNEPSNEPLLEYEAGQGRPPLAAVVRALEADDDIGAVLREGSSANRFRQTVGVAVKLKMLRLGWSTTGRQGTVPGSGEFKKAERYAKGEVEPNAYAARALAALDRIEQIGDEQERQQTATELMDALAESRAREGRPF